MCEDCFKNLIYKFDSQSDFEDFETIVQNKCLSKQIQIIKREETDFWAPFDSYEFYKCNSCGQVWILSIPENAWRGFFLTKEKGIEYTQTLKEKDRTKKIGCLVVAVVVGLLIIWNLVK